MYESEQWFKYSMWRHLSSYQADILTFFTPFKVSLRQWPLVSKIAFYLKSTGVITNCLANGGKQKRRHGFAVVLSSNIPRHCTERSTKVFLPFAAMGQWQQGLFLFRTQSSSLCITPGTSMELMMPHEDERNVPEEKMCFSTNRKMATLKQYHRQTQNSETVIFGCYSCLKNVLTTNGCRM